MGFAALLGLTDFRKDAFATGLHAWLIQRKYPQAEIAFSCPRLRPIINNDKINPMDVHERQLLQVVCAYRIFMPYASITVSTRECARVRDNLVQIAATKISAGVSTGVGSHVEEMEDKGDEQFEISDERTVDEVYQALEGQRPAAGNGGLCLCVRLWIKQEQAGPGRGPGERRKTGFQQDCGGHQPEAVQPSLSGTDRAGLQLPSPALILREKDLTEEEYRRLAEEVLAICRKYGVEMIPHTFVNVAAELGTECVHLPLPLLRELSGSAALRRFSRIGTSVHSPEEAAEAERLGAAYMTAGHIYATDCKRGLPPRGLEYLREVCRSTSLPVWLSAGSRWMRNGSGKCWKPEPPEPA